ncbi:MAG TPA: hypothetical protein VFN74_01300 [Chloroflexota bacterium]|nr:hypothetical protein [Chloroflexota bacterium]
MSRKARPRTTPRPADARTERAERPERLWRRWEYLEVDVHVETWSDSAGRSGRLPISEAGPGQVPSVVAVLNELGAEGWELSGVSNTQSPLIYRMLLKRRASAAD